ncbi:MAG TPA: KH domain-containing protein [Verrucomicrobiae bacterium]|nr:KH domain-containing protein [Verrucomicrobiae bacterium]
METETPTPAGPPARPSGPPLDPREVLQKMLDGLGLQTKVEVFTMDGSMLLHIATVEPGRLIGKHGQTLSQLQFLLNRILQRANPDAPRVTVDCERYRERQRDDILKKVVEAADRVRRWGESVKIGPFNAFDRRVIHLHMEKDRELEAISEGEGDEAGMKKMIIRVREKPSTPQAA